MFRQIFYSFTACVLLISTQSIFGADKYPDTLSFVIQNDEGQTVEEFDIPGADIEKLSGDTKGYIQAFLEWHGYTAGQPLTEAISLPAQLVTKQSVKDLIFLANDGLSKEDHESVKHSQQILQSIEQTQKILQTASFLYVNRHILQSMLDKLTTEQLCSLYIQLKHDPYLQWPLQQTIIRDSLPSFKSIAIEKSRIVDGKAITKTTDGKSIIARPRSSSSVKIWDHDNELGYAIRIKVEESEKASRHFSKTSDGKRIAFLHLGRIHILDRDDAGSIIRNIQLSDFEVGYSIAITPDGKRLVVGSDNTVLVFDLDNNGHSILTQYLTGRQAGPISSVAITADGARIVSGSKDGVIVVWSHYDTEAFHHWHYTTLCQQTDENFESVGITPDGKRIVVAYANTLQVWEDQFSISEVEEFCIAKIQSHSLLQRSKAYLRSLMSRVRQWI